MSGARCAQEDAEVGQRPAAMSGRKTVVLGGANVDIVASPDGRLVEGDSTAGSVRVSFGGVGRNIAEDMARLGARVDLVTVFGDDLLGRLCHGFCAECGIGLDFSAFTERHGTGTYVAVLGEDRDLHVAVADMAALDDLDPGRIAAALEALGPDDLCVADTNLGEEHLRAVARACPCALALDPVSAPKALRALPLLPGLAVLKTNRPEAEALCGFPLRGPGDYARAVDWFHSQGVGEVLVTLGHEGVMASDGRAAFGLRAPEVDVVNANGAGDSFLAAYLVTREQGWPFPERVSAGMRVAGHTLRSVHAVAPDLRPSCLLSQGSPAFERFEL